MGFNKISLGACLPIHGETRKTAGAGEFCTSDGV